MATRMLRDWTGSEAVDQLSEGAEVFFIRLIMKADDFGCYYGNPKILSSTLYPLKKVAHERIIKLRDECSKVGVIQVYSVDGKDYVCIPNFGQRLRAMNRKFPEPIKTTSPTDDGQMSDRCQTDDGRREEKGREEEVEEEVEEKGSAYAPPFEGLLLEKWNDWEKHRKEKRSPITPTARKQQIKLLGGRPPNEAIEILDYSLTNGYTGLFPEKAKNNEHRIAIKTTPQPTTTIIEQGKSFGLEKGFSRSGSDGRRN